MSLTAQREEAAEAEFTGYEWPVTAPVVAMGWSTSACGEKLVRPVLIEAEVGQFEVSFDPETSDVLEGAAWLNGERVGSCPGECPVHP